MIQMDDHFRAVAGGAAPSGYEPTGFAKRARGFTSGKTTHDPEPMRQRDDWGNTAGRGPLGIEPAEGITLAYDPRPEFDNHNPILVAFRSRADSFRGLEMEAAYDRANDAAWKKAGCPEFGQGGFTEWCAYEDHAWRVLERIADLTYRLTENGVTD